MTKFLFLFGTLLAVIHLGQAGFAGHQLGYSLGFGAPPAPFATPAPIDFGTTAYAGPLPAAPLSVNTYATTSHHTYTSATPGPVVKYHAFGNPIRAYALGPSIAKFGHLPSAYSFEPAAYGGGGPVSYEFSQPSESYGGWSTPAAAAVNFAAPVAAVGRFEAPRTVVKFGRPITTTTTTYATGGVGVGGAVPALQAYATPFAGPVGW
ncbi:uncharacterized protein LOC131997688 [Stomoxys calcitrans]|uniref:uncharacterized protein LOC131997688 n=1 Tax=Stomoxys calcitrans TaxID=35570 RepID=UPI0027E2F4D7|nr:uncharacterized protein LOC131997688 [Stomoxys calcitrans]